MIKKIILVNITSIIIGFSVGLTILLFWKIFSGIFLGWGDSAPEWYFNIQNSIHIGIIVLPIFFCVAIGNLYFRPKGIKNNHISA